MKIITCIIAFLFLLPLTASAQINWSDPRLLFAMEDVDGVLPVIGASGDTCHFAWKNFFWGMSSGYLLYCHTYDGGQTFSDTVNISGDTYQDSAPSMSVTGNSVYVSSSAKNSAGGNNRIVVRHSHDAGMNWSDTTKLDTECYSHEVGAWDDTVYVVWDDEDLINRVSVSVDGGLSYSHKITCGSRNEVQDGCAYEGVGHFVGNKQMTNAHEIIYQRFDIANGTVSPETVISPDDNYHSQHPSIAASNEGILHAAWFDYLNSPFGTTGWIYYRRSLDGGQSWDEYQILSETARGACPDICVWEGNVYLVWMNDWSGGLGGFDLYFRMSEDKGDTWSDVTHIYTNDITAHQPKIAKGNNHIYIAYHSSSWTGDSQIFYIYGEEQQSVVDRIVNPLLSPDNLITAYPNPFNSIIKISIYPNRSFQYLVITNLMGQAIKSFDISSNIFNQFTWNGEDNWGGSVSSGIYFVNLLSENEIYSEKIILIR